LWLAKARSTLSTIGRTKQLGDRGEMSMRNKIWSALVLGAAIALAGSAAAQQPAQPPAAAPTAAAPAAPAGPPPSYGNAITVEQAKKVAAAAVAESRKNNWFMVISIVDPAGELVYFEKMDNAQYASIQISQGKARTAAKFKRPTKVFADAMAGGANFYLSFEGLVASPGGVPIMEGGKIIGAIGVSGATGAQDHQVGTAAVAALGS
jgi:glc operon protein GlcG